MDVLLVNRPNLNLLGTRQPEVYGRTTLADVEASVQAQAKELGLDVECFQNTTRAAASTGSTRPSSRAAGTS